MNLTPALLRAAVGCTADLADIYAEHLAYACAMHDITGPVRMAAFLAQVGHESGSFKHTAEVWGPTDAQRTYEGRKSLGNTQIGDGYFFRGRGLIQCTGRANFTQMAEWLGLDLLSSPEQLEQPRWAALSAATWWARHGCNQLADSGDFEALTRRINGGTNGLEDRLKRWDRAKQALAVDTSPQPVQETPKTVHVPPRPDAEPYTSEPPAQPAPQPEKPKMAIPAIVAALLPTLIESIPKLAGIFKPGSAVAERNVAAATAAFQIAQQAVGAVNAQETVERIQADPSAQAAAAKAIEAHWFELAESGGGGIDGARKAALEYSQPDGPRFWFNPAFWISVVLLAMPLMLLVDVFYVHPSAYVGEIRTQIVTGILLIISMVGGYWIGTSFSSAKKDERQQ